MSVAEFIRREGDVDIVDDVCEELYIAVCRPVLLTEEGKREFADVLEYTVMYDEDDDDGIALLCIEDDDDEVWERRLRRATKFFYGHAGYCSAEKWDRWFIED